MANEEIGIAASHIPTIASGKYEVKANLQNNLADVQRQDVAFYIAGYNHAIPQNEVLAMYPPMEHTGNFAGTFPHIQFRRSTLPWEYHCEAKGKRIPYIFLVLLKEEELASGKFEILEKNTNALKDALEEATEPKPLKILNALKDNDGILPSIDLMSQLAHARIQEHKELTELNLPKETSIVISHRMVEPDTRYRAFVCYYSTEIVDNEDKYQLSIASENNAYQSTRTCVVLSEWSFESIAAGLYQIDANKLKHHPEFDKFKKDLVDSPITTLEQLKTKANAELIKLISTNETYLEGRADRWTKMPEPRSMDDFERIEKISFGSENNHILEFLKYNGKNLKGYLHELKLQPFKTNIDPNNKAVTKLIDVAKVPLEHQLKAGGKIISWYQGPFTNWNYSFDLKKWSDDKEWKHLPDHQDYLNLFNEDTGMYDMTYAAAWQLGRLKIMNDNKVFQELKKWKYELELHNLVMEQNKYSHLPSLEVPQPSVPDALSNYVAELIQFRNFPIYYLLPHMDLSTEESIKYFKIDNSWILSFLFGIFSAGPRLSIEDFQHYILADKAINAIFDNDKNYYGILLQSQTIKNWPHLVVELDKSHSFHYVTSLNNTLRLYVTDQKFSNIGMYLKNENAHFGTEYTETTRKYIPDGNNEDSVAIAKRYLYKQPRIEFDIK